MPCSLRAWLAFSDTLEWYALYSVTPEPYGDGSFIPPGSGLATRRGFYCLEISCLTGPFYSSMATTGL